MVKSNNFCHRKVVRGTTIWVAIEKRSFKSMYKTPIEKGRKYVTSDNFCYHKGGKAKNIWEAIEKSPLLLSQY